MNERLINHDYNIVKPLINKLTLKDYHLRYAHDLYNDYKLIDNYFNINDNYFYLNILNMSYKKMLKHPRLRVNYYNLEIELYNQRYYQAILIHSFLIRR
ncbi:MAG: hypothetical protein LBR40_04830 [Bacilli bacterium]|nr:hypothetical protein [Bacilli bacterium]